MCAVFDIIIGVSVFSSMWLELLMMLDINVPLSLYEYQSVKCAFTSLVRMKSCVLVMCCLMCLMLHNEVTLYHVMVCIGWKL